MNRKLLLSIPTIVLLASTASFAQEEPPPLPPPPSHGLVTEQPRPPQDALRLQPLAGSATTAAMGTAFTYQGQLRKSGAPVNGTCNFQFSLFDALSGGTQIGTTQTRSGVAVTNGLFTIPDLDFGGGAFNGAARWLAIAVQCPGDSGYTALSPRQALTPAPYALALPGLWTQQNATSPNLVGGYHGNQVTNGVVAATIGGGGDSVFLNRVTDNYSTVGGGASNRAGNNAGTVVDAPFATVGGGKNNIASGDSTTVGGGQNNAASGSGATVGGGLLNTASGDRSTVGGGYQNTASSSYATVGGGDSNTANVYAATVGGGTSNTASGTYATAGGGWQNTASGDRSTVGGGYQNTASGVIATVGGGYSNTVSSDYATVGGGSNNTASGDWSTAGGGWKNTASGLAATVGGGFSNTVSGGYATVSGGYSNTVAADSATVGGGAFHTVTGMRATVGGGWQNTAGGDTATIGGGESNTASGFAATVGGGASNTASSEAATVGGGVSNTASGQSSTVGGGVSNNVAAVDATIGGGTGNVISATAAAATIPGGYRAQATHYGELAYASGMFANPGDAQSSLYVLRRTTTSASFTPLYLDGSSNQITIAAGRTVAFEILVAARDNSGNSAGYRFRGVVENLGAGAVLLSPAAEILHEDVTGWDALVTTSSNDLVIQVAGGTSASPARWVAVVRTAEVGW